MRRLRLVVSVMCVLALSIVPVFAHEGRDIGDFVLEFGWRVEPAFAGIMNGPEVFIEMHEGGELPADLAVDLQAEVTFGADSLTLILEPAYGETGYYIADLLPTLPGDYTFVISGTIGDMLVNETFNSADGEFSSVEPASDVAFPPTASLEARLAALEARIAELEAALASS
ncbi:MAG: ABC transporter C-terminal domain-containing protein [Chloroflexota bacterium]|nr:ABC transporter C-terminal domain-containing protein [Chloroflexota bacterium]